MARYNKYLKSAESVGIGKAVKVGLGNGFLFASAFFIYALAFWYGSRMVAADLPCILSGGSGCITGTSFYYTNIVTTTSSSCSIVIWILLLKGPLSSLGNALFLPYIA